MVVRFIDVKKKVTTPNHMENLVAELLARNVQLGINRSIRTLKGSLKADELLWWIEKNPGVSDTKWNSSYFTPFTGRDKFIAECFSY